MNSSLSLHQGKNKYPIHTATIALWAVWCLLVLCTDWLPAKLAEEHNWVENTQLVVLLVALLKSLQTAFLRQKGERAFWLGTVALCFILMMREVSYLKEFFYVPGKPVLFSLDYKQAAYVVYAVLGVFTVICMTYGRFWKLLASKPMPIAAFVLMAAFFAAAETAEKNNLQLPLNNGQAMLMEEFSELMCYTIATHILFVFTQRRWLDKAVFE